MLIKIFSLNFFPAIFLFFREKMNYDFKMWKPCQVFNRTCTFTPPGTEAYTGGGVSVLSNCTPHKTWVY